MNTQELVKLGLSKSEATLYLALLKIGRAGAQELANETGFYDANTYQALERLCNKGIVSKIIEGKKKIYQIQKPEALVEFIMKKKSDIEVQERLAKELVKKVEAIKQDTSSHETAVVFRGISGVKQIYSEILKDKLDYFVFGSPFESEEIVGDYYWQNLHLKQREAKIKAKMIFHKSLRHWRKIVPRDIISLKFLDEKLEPLTETTIFGNKVAFTVWTEKPVVTIINNKHVADSYMQIFEILWRKAKK